MVGSSVAVGKGVGGIGDGVANPVVGVAMEAVALLGVSGIGDGVAASAVDLAVVALAVVGVGGGSGVATWAVTAVASEVALAVVAVGTTVLKAGDDLATGAGSGGAVEAAWEQPRLNAASNVATIGVIFRQRQ